jgi:hypothetical protein
MWANEDRTSVEYLLASYYVQKFQFQIADRKPPVPIEVSLSVSTSITSPPPPPARQIPASFYTF